MADNKNYNPFSTRNIQNREFLSLCKLVLKDRKLEIQSPTVLGDKDN